MGFPRYYRQSTEGIIASYNYSDINEGTGVVVYYGFNSNTGGSDAYSMSTNALYSNDVYTQVTCDNAGAFEKEGDLDFDIEFNKPQRIKGKFRAVFTMAAGDTGANKRTQAYIIIKVRKYSGSTETEIASGQGETVDGTTSTERVYATQNIEIDISSIQHFKKGDILRVTAEIWGKSTDSDGRALLAHDPKDRTSSLLATGTALSPDSAVFEIHVPYQIDL